jgi:diadenosine tetraphosphate (Ap4A) HIT family hydrolase
MEREAIHPQLRDDCHLLGRLGSGALLLSRNAALHWFILVPETDRIDLLDLEADQRSAVLADCAAVSGFLKQQLGYPRVNFAGLGNVVPQMHLHIIGRRAGDACWPAPVWGNLPDGGEYDVQALRLLGAGLAAAAGLAQL